MSRDVQDNSIPPREPTDGPRDGFERLVQASRVDFRMLTDGQEITPEIQSELRGEFRDWRRDNARSDGKPFPITQAAPLVGVSTGVLTDWAHGKYKGDNARVTRLVDEFLAREREKLGRHDFRQFAKISQTKTISATIEAGIAQGTCPVIIIPPGGGKSVHGLALSRDRSGVVLLRIEDEPCGKQALTELFCDVIQELRPMKAQPHRRRFDSIKNWLRKRRNTILVVDESQKLSKAGLELLRDLHDISDPTGHRCMPIVFFGDENFRKLLGEAKEGKTNKLQPQMVRRLLPVYDAERDGGASGSEEQYTVEDIVRIVRNDRVRLLTHRATRWLTDLANTPGYGLIGFALAVLRQAALMFRSMIGDGGQLDIPQLQESLMMTAGRSVAREINSAAGGRLLKKAN